METMRSFVLVGAGIALGAGIVVGGQQLTAVAAVESPRYEAVEVRLTAQESAAVVAAVSDHLGLKLAAYGIDDFDACSVDAGLQLRFASDGKECKARGRVGLRLSGAWAPDVDKMKPIGLSPAQIGSTSK
jgi:hypothetical protein